mgnify:CR=1 FL=1
MMGLDLAGEGGGVEFPHDLGTCTDTGGTLDLGTCTCTDDLYLNDIWSCQVMYIWS